MEFTIHFVIFLFSQQPKTTIKSLKTAIVSLLIIQGALILATSICTAWLSAIMFTDEGDLVHSIVLVLILFALALYIPLLFWTKSLINSNSYVISSADKDTLKVSNQLKTTAFALNLIITFIPVALFLILWF